MHRRTFLLMTVVGVAMIGISLVSCRNTYTPTPNDIKHLDKFHQRTTPNEALSIVNNNLALYVDYSNCISNGMQSPFYQRMVSPLTAATTEYWSIKGDKIEQQQGNVYALLNNVYEVSYAALDSAVNMMADRDSESVLLTDGELFTLTKTKNNPNNPYMHAAFKKWLMKGRDIHIIAEPFQEVYQGKTFNKKRFYIIFTDDRLQGNIYDRIKEIVGLEQFPEVDEFHLSGNYPWIVPVNGVASEANEILGANVKPHGTYEIQDWQVDWKNITNLIFNGVDEEGNPLPKGEKLIGGLRINKNAFGAYRISDIDVRVSNINVEYFDFYNKFESDGSVGKQDMTLSPIPNFIIVDKDEFKKHGFVDLYFDIENFAPSEDLNGKPFNYVKIEIVISGLQDILDNSVEMFTFDSIVNVGQDNVSISESLKNCVFDPELKQQLLGKVLYTIYVKSNKY